MLNRRTFTGLLGATALAGVAAPAIISPALGAGRARRRSPAAPI